MSEKLVQCVKDCYCNCKEALAKLQEVVDLLNDCCDDCCEAHPSLSSYNKEQGGNDGSDSVG
jgi:hypothetical protein